MNKVSGGDRTFVELFQILKDDVMKVLHSICQHGRSAGEGIGYPLQYSWASLVAQLVKNLPNVGDLGLIPGLGRSPGEGKGYPLQYSGQRIP